MKKDCSKVVEYYSTMEHNPKVNIHYLHRLIKFIKGLCVKYPSVKRRGSMKYPTHHIIPRSWGGNNDNENLLTIPHRAHYLIHWIMYRAFPNDSAMRSAFYLMSHVMGATYITSREFAVLQKQMNEYLKLNSQFINRVPVINLITGEFELLDKSIYESDANNYKHIRKGIKNSPEIIEKMKLAFLTGERVSERKNKVMARNVITGEKKLIDENIYYATSEWVGISTGMTRSEEHKKIVSDYMKTFKKTDVQKESARKMIAILASKKIKCECCGREFDPGNYKKHLLYKSSGDWAKSMGPKISKGLKESHAREGTSSWVYSFRDGDEQFICYDYNFMLSYFGISCHTMKKRYSHKKMAMHRNRILTSKYRHLDLSDMQVFEDVCGI